MTAEMTLAAGAESIERTFADLFGRIADWRDHLEEVIADAAGTVGTDELDGLVEQLVVPALTGPRSLMIGAGFVAAPGFLADTPWHLAWWLGNANTFGVSGGEPSIRRLATVEDPSSETFRDYTALEWWRVPATTGARHITGPYVDYLCTDDYTLTLTMPVTFRGSMVGVVGADLYVVDVERALLPAIATIPAETTTLINASGRVLVSTDPHRATGSILRETGEGRRVAVGDTSLLLVLEGGTGS